MSHPSSSSSFQSLFNAGLRDYANQTGTKLDDHPIAKQLEECESMDSFISVLHDNAREFREFQGEDGKIVKSLKCAVHVLYALSTSTALGEGIGLVCPKFLVLFFIAHMCSIAIPTCKGSFCCFRNLARCMSLSPFSYAYPRDS